MTWSLREAGNVAEPCAQTERASEEEEHEKFHSVQYPVLTLPLTVRSHWGLADVQAAVRAVWSGLLLKEGSLGSGEAALLRRTL